VPKEETVEQFALKRLAANISDIDQKRTTLLLDGLFRQHFENLVIDEDDRAAGLLLMARQIHDYYQSSVKRRAGIITLDAFTEMYQRSRNDFLDPTNGALKPYRDRLRTKLNLPPETVPPLAPPPANNPQPAK
jgi:hypothetical protein